MTEAPALTFPFRRTDPLLPPDEYTGLRTVPPVEVPLGQGRRVWLVTRYDAVRRLLSDPHVVPDTHPVLPELAAHALGQWRLAQDAEPARATARRRAVAAELALPRVARLRTRVEEITREHVARMLADGPSADLVAAVAHPVPAAVACELLGVPQQERELVAEWARLLASAGVDVAEQQRARRALTGYLHRLVGDGRGTGGLLAHLASDHDVPVDHDQLVALGDVLLVGGQRATAAMIGLGALALMTHPQQRARMTPERWPRAVEELMRFFSVADGAAQRVVRADVEVDGVLIRAGERVVALTAAADHDPTVFARADRLDLERVGPPHVAFGHGVHQCLGQHLVRLELEVVLGALVTQVPGLRLAVPRGDLVFPGDAALHAPERLPVTW